MRGANVTTLHKGGIEVLLGDGEPIETGLAIIAEVERIQERWRVNGRLRAIKHGHCFDYYRVCECGMSERDYYLDLRFSNDVCPILMELP